MASASDSISEPAKKKAKARHDSGGNTECETDSMSEVSKRLLNISELNYDLIVDFKFLLGLELQGGRKTLQLCQKLGLIGDRYECTKCKKEMQEHVRKNSKDEFVWRCLSQNHEAKRSIRKGSWFSNVKLDMNMVLQIVWLWVHKASCELIKAITKCSSMTVCDWTCQCREVCVQLIIEESEPIGGPKKIVEIEYSKVGVKQRLNRGENVEGKYLIGGIERKTNRCFLRVMNDNSKESLISVLREYVMPDTIIQSDNWKCEDPEWDQFLTYLQTNHSLQFQDPDKFGISTKSSWCMYKKSLGHLVKDSMPYYMAEYMWRKNVRQGNRFMHFIDAIVKVYPPLCKDDENE